MEHEHYAEAPRDDRRVPLESREYPDDRRRREWDAREVIDSELEMERRGYVREESRPPGPSLKPRENWDSTEYREWERQRRAPHEWERREEWEQPVEALEEEWRHYNRSLESWQGEDRRRWPEFQERTRPGPKSTSSHVQGNILLKRIILSQY